MIKNKENKKFISNNLKIEKINSPFHKDMSKVLNLYYNSFPENELMDFTIFFSTINGYVLTIYDQEQFIGFAAIIAKNNIVNIFYFAIESNLRGKGYGTQFLKQLCDNFKNNIIILDVEDPDGINNKAEYERRLKRINFYLRAGFSITNIRYVWSHEQYIIMINNGKEISEKEFWDFWKKRK